MPNAPETGTRVRPAVAAGTRSRITGAAAA